MSVESKPTKIRLSELGVYSWPKWESLPGQYELQTEAQQTFFLLRGRVKFIPKDSTYDPIEFGAGDLVTIPKGLTCTWDISVAVHAHYKFEP